MTFTIVEIIIASVILIAVLIVAVIFGLSKWG